MDPMPSSSVVAPSKSPSLLLFVVVLGAIASVVVGIVWWHLGERSLVSSESRFLMTEGGASSWYQIRGSTIMLAPGPQGFDEEMKNVFNVSKTLQSGDRVVLLETEEGKHAVGRIYSEGTYIPLVEDEGFKHAVSSTDEGTVYYSVFKKGDAQTSEGTWQMMKFEMYRAASITPNAVGEGFEGAVTADGAYLAIAPEGIVRVDEGGKRFTLIETRDVTYGVSAVSPDGKFVVVPNTATNALDIFTVSTDDSRSLSYSGSLTTPVRATAFLSSTQLVVKNDEGMFTIFNLDKIGKVSSKKTYSFSPN